MENTAKLKVEDINFDVDYAGKQISEEFGNETFLEAALAIFETPKPDPASRIIPIQKREQLETYSKLQTDIKQLQNNKKEIDDAKDKLITQKKMFDSVIAKMMATDMNLMMEDKKPIYTISESPEFRTVEAPSDHLPSDDLQDILDSFFIVRD